MLVEINHRLRYEYDRPVSLSHQIIRLRPNNAKDYDLTILPGSDIEWRIMPRGHSAAMIRSIGPTSVFEIASKSTVKVDDIMPRGVGSIMDDCRSVHEKVRYLDRMDQGVQDPGETLRLGTGTCRDIAWLLVDVLRSKNMDARFVSGYFVRMKPVLSAELHAWVEVCDRGRWVGLDPTFGTPVNGCHVPLACTRHYRDAVPVSGRVDPPAEVVFSWEMGCRIPCESPETAAIGRVP